MKTTTKLSFKELLDTTSFSQYIDKAVVAEVEPFEEQKIEFFTIGKWASEEEVEAEATKLGLELAHPYALALYAKENPAFADGKPTATQWKGTDEKWRFAYFGDWGGRGVCVDCDDGAWGGRWRFAASRKSPVPESPLPSLEEAIRICKDAGLTVTKTY